MVLTVPPGRNGIARLPPYLAPHLAVSASASHRGAQTGSVFVDGSERSVVWQGVGIERDRIASSERLGFRIGQRIRALGVWQEVAEAAGYSLEELAGIERGSLIPPDGFILAIARGRGVPEVLRFLRRLFGREIHGDFEAREDYWIALRLLKFSERYSLQWRESIAIYRFFNLPRVEANLQARRVIPPRRQAALSAGLYRTMREVGLSGAELAGLLFVHPSAPSLWYLGKRCPPEPLVVSLRKARGKAHASFLVCQFVQDCVERFRERNPYCGQVIVLREMVERKGSRLSRLGLPGACLQGKRDLTEVIAAVRDSYREAEFVAKIRSLIAATGTLRLYQEDPPNKGLREAMGRLRVPPAELAGEIGISVRTLRRWACGIRYVPPRAREVVDAVCRARSLGGLRRSVHEAGGPLKRMGVTPQRGLRQAESDRVVVTLREHPSFIARIARWRLHFLGVLSPQNLDDLFQNVREQVARAVMRGSLPSPGDCRSWLAKVIRCEAIKIACRVRGIRRAERERVQAVGRLAQRLGRPVELEDLVAHGLTRAAAERYFDEYRLWTAGARTVGYIEGRLPISASQ